MDGVGAGEMDGVGAGEERVEASVERFRTSKGRGEKKKARQNAIGGSPHLLTRPHTSSMCSPLGWGGLGIASGGGCW
jgi:hypothetical protein